MANIGDPITPSVPTVGSAGPQFATDINAILTEIVARLSTKVPLASVNFNSSLDLSGSDLLNIGNIVFANSLNTPSGSPFNRVAVFGGNLYYVNSAGAVQITSGSTLNAAALAGITGDYGGANPAQLNYVAIDTRYNFYANFGTGTWAYARALGFDVAGGTTSTARARLLWGGVANIDITLPTVLPSANRLMSIDNTGLITSGTSTALDTNNHITLTGTGQYKHGLRTRSVLLSNTPFHSSGDNFLRVMSDATTEYVALPPLATHERLVNVTVGFRGTLQRSNTTVTLAKIAPADPAGVAVSLSDIGSTTFSNAGTALKTLTGANLTSSPGTVFFVKLVTGGSGQGGDYGAVYYDYDVP